MTPPDVGATVPGAAGGPPPAGVAASAVADGTPGADATQTAILDAAAESVLAFGVRRTSLSEVARRAGVSRPTVYRHWPDLAALVADVMTREWMAVFAAVEPDRADFGSVREFTVGCALAIVRALRSHPLLVKIIDVDPELLQPYIFDRLGAGQRMALQFLIGQIEAGQRDGSVRAGDPATMALTVLMAAQSFVFSGRVATTAVPAQHVDAQVATMLDRYLRPGNEA